MPDIYNSNSNENEIMSIKEKVQDTNRWSGLRSTFLRLLVLDDCPVKYVVKLITYQKKKNQKVVSSNTQIFHLYHIFIINNVNRHNPSP